MAKYAVIKLEDLSTLLPAMKILERVGSISLDYCVYGLTSDPGVIAQAEEAIKEEGDDEDLETSHHVSEVAVAIPLSSDSLYFLEGSGMPIKHLEFAYMTGGEGARTSTFLWRNSSTKILSSAFTKLAISDDDTWIDDFLQKNASPEAPEVSRTEEATSKDEPVEAAPEENPSQQAPGKLSSLRSLVDRFLGE